MITLSPSPGTVFGAQTGCDGHDPATFSAVSGVPHPRRIDQCLAGRDLDDVVAVVELLHEAVPAGARDHYLGAERMALPGRPGTSHWTHHHHPSIGTVGARRPFVGGETFGGPVEVVDRVSGATGAEMDRHLR